jgi:uncharacterized damage-inducible protein DinB
VTVADLTRRFEYGYWANRKLFAIVGQLTPAEFTRDVAGSYGSVRNTLVHMLSAEWGWIARCGGPERGPALKAGEYPTFETLVEKWLTVEGYVYEFLRSLTDADLSRPIEFDLGRGVRMSPVGELLEHAANHSVHHRGQVALLLRVLGRAPGNIDLLIYDGEQRAVRP